MSGGSFRLRKKGSGFTQIPNSLINDNRISFRAKGIWALIESKPDNWVFREANLIGSSTEGRDAFRAAAKELIQFGWLKRFQERDSHGHFVTVYELLYSPLTGNPSTVKPSTDNQATYKDGENKKDNITPQPPRGPKGWEEDSEFKKLTDAYAKINPSRVDAKRAYAVWKDRDLASSLQQLLDAFPSFACLEQWKKDGGQYVPSLSKWLEDGAWRNQAKVAVQVSAEVLAERARINREGLSALARVESCRRFGTEPEPDDIEAVKRWRILQKEMESQT